MCLGGGGLRGPGSEEAESPLAVDVVMPVPVPQFIYGVDVQDMVLRRRRTRADMLDSLVAPARLCLNLTLSKQMWCLSQGASA